MPDEAGADFDTGLGEWTCIRCGYRNDGAICTKCGTTPRTTAVLGVFGYAAALTPRSARTYDEWVAEVTARFKRAWAALAAEVHT